MAFGPWKRTVSLALHRLLTESRGTDISLNRCACLAMAGSLGLLSWSVATEAMISSLAACARSASAGELTG